MTLRITCETCGCCYAVVGVGYFCPACGHNSADVTFDQSVDRARHAIAALPAI
jgi:Zn finger protein HypA/HybF involved in hydrogenase expression